MALTGDIVRKAKLRLLQMHFNSRVGHIGGNLSALDILLTLYHDVLGTDDQFILSKGHGAGALYVALWSKGLLADDDLKTFHAEETRLSGHPAPGVIPEIPFATGSLGHGFSLAAGMALAKRLKGEAGRVHCLTSDGEWNEGSTWEALIFAAHQKLANLSIVVDLNGLQGFGTTAEVADLAPLAEKFRTFNVETIEISGHHHAALAEALRRPQTRTRVIVATTTKGAGVSYMSHQMHWHYLPMSAEQYGQAVGEVEQECGKASAAR